MILLFLGLTLFPSFQSAHSPRLAREPMLYEETHTVPTTWQIPYFHNVSTMSHHNRLKKLFKMYIHCSNVRPYSTSIVLKR